MQQNRCLNFTQIRLLPMIALKVLASIALVGSIAWFCAQPDFEPAIAIVTSLSALVGSFFLGKRDKTAKTQRQTVAAGSVGIQAGGDVSVGGIQASNRQANEAK